MELSDLPVRVLTGDRAHKLFALAKQEQFALPAANCLSWRIRIYPAEIAEAISYGVVKMNIDTDLQWAF